MRLLIMIGLAGLLCGCATRDVRLKKNAALLAQFSEEQQQAIREGKIDVGYTKDMVFLAFGKPSQVSTRVSEAQHNEVWTYRGYRTRFSSQSHGYYGHYAHHSRHHCAPFYPMHVTTQDHEAYDKLKVVFADDKVVSYESVN